MWYMSKINAKKLTRTCRSKISDDLGMWLENLKKLEYVKVRVCYSKTAEKCQPAFRKWDITPVDMWLICDILWRNKSCINKGRHINKFLNFIHPPIFYAYLSKL